MASNAAFITSKPNTVGEDAEYTGLTSFTFSAVPLYKCEPYRSRLTASCSFFHWTKTCLDGFASSRRIRKASCAAA